MLDITQLGEGSFFYEGIYTVDTWTYWRYVTYM